MTTGETDTCGESLAAMERSRRDHPAAGPEYRATRSAGIDVLLQTRSCIRRGVCRQVALVERCRTSTQGRHRHGAHALIMHGALTDRNAHRLKASVSPYRLANGINENFRKRALFACKLRHTSHRKDIILRRHRSLCRGVTSGTGLGILVKGALSACRGSPHLACRWCADARQVAQARRRGFHAGLSRKAMPP